MSNPETTKTSIPQEIKPKQTSNDKGVISRERGAINKVADRLLGEKRELKKYWSRVKLITEKESAMAALTDEELKNKTFEFRQKLKGLKDKDLAKKLDEILPEAFAVVREASFRAIGQKHYPVQLIGGMVLHEGRIAEMKTGEGKTLVATLATYLNALPEQNQVHVVTVNDYLARRDASWMGRIYDFLGLTIGVIQNQSQFYFEFGAQADPVAKEKRKQGMVDSAEDGEMEGRTVLDVENLVACDRKRSYWNEDANIPVDIVYGVNSEFGFDYLRDNLAVLPSELVQRAGHRVAVVDEVDSILIDEARTPLIISQPGSTPSARYKQFTSVVRKLTPIEDYTVDEKIKSCFLTPEGIIKVEQLLGISDLYANPDNLNLVFHTDTALRAQNCYKKEVDYVVKDNEIVLVDTSTGRMMFGRRYSEGLHQALEAKEGIEVKAESYTAASITYQNFFKLYEKLSGMTGTASTESEELFKTYKLLVVTIPTNKPMVRKDFVDKIFKNETGKFKAVVRDIAKIHETGQPILVGTSSIQKNEILSSLLQQAGIKHSVLNAKNHEQEARIISNAGRIGSVVIATNIAGRGVDIKLGGEKPESEKDQEIWRQERERVLSLGGLYVFGTERHESRRIDNQLRGRSGRQGDPGSSQFYLALNDEILRNFGEERLKIYQALPIPEDEPIQLGLISKLIEQAQKKIESYHYDNRKNVMEHDDVINKQRTVIYAKRQKILTNNGFDEKVELQKTITREIGRCFDELPKLNLKQIDTAKGASSKTLLSKLSDNLKRIHPLEFFDVDQLKKIIIEKNQDKSKIVPQIAEKTYNSLMDKWKIYNPQVQHGMGRYLYLRGVDNLWTEHLITVDYLADSVRFAGYSQKTPLTEYKREGMRLFLELLKEVDKEIARTAFKVSPELVNPELLN
ncbi:MAG: preprotein translocase subunit SecA [Patescibacteria group bacterium]